MTDGDKIRLIGSGGAPFVTTVGTPFSAKEIQGYLDSGEWTLPAEPEPKPVPAKKTAASRPRSTK